MLHLVAHSVPPSWLIHDWHEAAQLWHRMQKLGPLRAAVIMPDHVHVILRNVAWSRWLGCLSGYARWRNHHRDEHGRAVWLPAPPAQEIQSHQHLRTTIRYVHLNPCRGKLVEDPLAWPFDTHRDAVGLAIPGVAAPERDPPHFHAYVSSDPSVAVDGSDLPYGLRGLRDHSLESIQAAVSALTRTTIDDQRRRGPARRLLIQALRELTTMSVREIGRFLGMSHAAVHACPPIAGADLAKLERVLGDPRFGPLHDGVLTRERAWYWYRETRIQRGAYAKLRSEAEGALRRRARSKRPH